MPSIDALRQQAVRREERLIRRNYSEEQLGELKTQHFEAAMDRLDREKAMADIVRPMKAEIKELKGRESDLITEIRNRFFDEKAECLLVPDYEAGMMMIYDAKDGELVESRKLHPSERQTNAFTESVIA